MARPEGFLWSDPGMISITVPYHDTNDFYFSGHVGTATLWMCEYFAEGYTIMGVIAAFVMVGEWTVLTLLRTHYIIDLVTAAPLAHLCWI